MIRVLLGLGSNKSYNNFTSVELLKFACNELSKILIRPNYSSIYKTKAMYVTDQNDFYNMTVVGYVDENMSPFFLLSEIHKIENLYGRDRSKEIRFGPRSLDIDIELFGDKEIYTEELQIPHVRLKERAFVLIPAIEILEKDADVKMRELFQSWIEELKEKNSLSGVEKLSEL